MHDGGDERRSQDVSVEQVAALAQQNTLPEPTLDISLLSYSATTTTTTTATTTAVLAAANSSSSNGGSSGRGQGVVGGSATLRNSTAVVLPPPADDPWMTGRFGGAGAGAGTFPGADATSAGINGGVPSSVSGTGLPSGWWKKQESASVQFGGQHGFVLNRYIVYGITTEVRKKGKHTHAHMWFFCSSLPPSSPVCCHL
jgi:sorting nexin-8